MPGRRFASDLDMLAFSRPSDVTRGGQPVSPFTWKTTDGLSTPNRWLDMSLREQRNVPPTATAAPISQGGDLVAFGDQDAWLTVWTLGRPALVNLTTSGRRASLP